MGWEIRKGNRYYYRKVRRPNGKVQSIYVGKEPGFIAAMQQLTSTARMLGNMGIDLFAFFGKQEEWLDYTKYRRWARRQGKNKQTQPSKASTTSKS